MRWLAGGVALTVLACSGAAVTPVRYVLPDDFDGWVVVEYEVSGAPTLPVAGGRRQIVVPPSGYVATSSPQEFGRVDLLYERQDGAVVPMQPGPADGPRAAAFACCLYTGERTEGGRTRRYEASYVGRGPVGEPPPWPR